MLTKVVNSSTLDNPVGLYNLLGAASEFVSVDDTLTNGGLSSLTRKLRSLPPGSVTFLRAPVLGLGREGAQSVVYLNQPQAQWLWSSLKSGTTASYVERHADDALGAVTR